MAIGRSHPDGTLDARLYYKPLVTLIWVGALIMALGGACSLADRRLRIGVARRSIALRGGSDVSKIYKLMLGAFLSYLRQLHLP